MLPTFETARLLVRARSMADFEDCLAMDRDPDVTRYVPGPWADERAHRRFLTGRMTARFGKGLGYWSIVPRERPEHFLGWVLLIPDAGIGPEIEIGWRLNRHAWGKGHATEAAAPIVDHAFTTLALEQIIAVIHPGNGASMRVAEKIGLRQVRHTPEARTYALGRKDWQTQAGRSPHESPRKSL
ncbi:MAG: GNAT family N-acetyltransferase [Phyllobacterium sp.]